MAISGLNNIPYGYTIRCNIEGHHSVDEIHSDGKVDPSFVQPGDDFIPSISDPRVKDFLLTGLPPESEWKEVGDGEWSYGHQLLSSVAGLVKLQSWIDESGDRVTHHVEAPFRNSTGKVNLSKSTEGFRIA